MKLQVSLWAEWDQWLIVTVCWVTFEPAFRWGRGVPCDWEPTLWPASWGCSPRYLQRTQLNRGHKTQAHSSTTSSRRSIWWLIDNISEMLAYPRTEKGDLVLMGLVHRAWLRESIQWKTPHFCVLSFMLTATKQEFSSFLPPPSSFFGRLRTTTIFLT